jgi:hypothetical protein
VTEVGRNRAEVESGRRVDPAIAAAAKVAVQRSGRRSFRGELPIALGDGDLAR